MRFARAGNYTFNLLHVIAREILDDPAGYTRITALPGWSVTFSPAEARELNRTIDSLLEQEGKPRGMRAKETRISPSPPNSSRPEAKRHPRRRRG